MACVPAIMVQGTGSDVGKSVLVAGLARVFSRRGLNVRPFKPQNMSNNAGIARGRGGGSGEIGRAQVLQARAAGVEPSVDMNPVLLKPESAGGAQVVVRGRRDRTLSARQYLAMKAELLPLVLESLARLEGEADIIVAEGAGSPAEINLRANDIANMGFAAAASIPVILVGDVDRGGVIASLVGTHAVLQETESARVRGYLINRFRGDVSLFEGGVAAISERTGWPCLGVIPHLPFVSDLPAEDSLSLQAARPSAPEPGGTRIKIAVPRLERIANFDDLDPLRLEPALDLEIIDPGSPLPGDAQLVLIPGTKSTIADLDAFRREGWDIDLAAHIRRGGRVLGLCGGYQMLGRSIRDPEGIESQTPIATGLGHLAVDTELQVGKNTRPVEATDAATGTPLRGYEIHIGETRGPDCERPFAFVSERPEGARSLNGQIMGTYIHGLFAHGGFRRAFLETLGPPGPQKASALDYESSVEAALDRLADSLEECCDIEAILTIAKSRSRP